MFLKNWREQTCKGVIYLGTSKTEGKSYIGLTRRPFKTRVSGHEKDATAGKGKDGSLQEVIRKHGFDDIEFRILDHAENLGELADKECSYIEKYNTLKPNGYNHNRGGSVATGGTAFEFLGEIYLSYADLADHYDIYEETLRKRIHANWTLRQATELDHPPIIKREGEHWQVGELKFTSSVDLCKKFEIHERTFKARLENGWPLLQACGLVEREQNTHLFKGKEYSSIKELAEAHGLPYDRVTSRLTAGLSLLEAMDPEENRKRYGKKPIEINGVNYASLIEAAKKLDLTRAKLSKRLEYLNPDKSKAKLIPLEKRKPWVKKKRTLIVEGRTFVGIMELSRHYKLSEGTIRKRLNRGETIEKAVGLTTEETVFPLEFQGKTFNTQEEISKFYGVKGATFSYRFNKAKWTLQESLGLAKRDVKIKTVTVQGEEFPSMSAVARHFGIQLVTLSGRLLRKWTLEEACNLKSRTQVQAKRRVYMVTHPDGTEETVSNLSQFGRTHNLASVGNLSFTIRSSKNHSYKGYKIRDATKEEIATLLARDPTALAAKANHKLTHEIEYDGKTYRSKRNFCEKMEINYAKFCNQINKGATVEEAVEYCQNRNDGTPGVG